MFQNRLSISLPFLQSPSTIVLALIIVNLIFNIISNASFKNSAFSPSWRGVFGWQVVGNLAGLVTVITLTVLLRYLPLSIAFPITTGLTILGVQFVATRMYFHEPTSAVQWIGALLIVGGIFLVQR